MSPPRIALFTIASKNYLAHVRVLLESVARVHPEYKLYLCLADVAASKMNRYGEPFEVVQADEIGIANFDDMSIRYDIMEFNTAVKPSMIRWLFDHTDADAVIYLDPDICVYAPLEAVEARFAEGASVVLTPHITQPLEDGKAPDDHDILQSGVFNLGFIGVQRCDEALRFVDWWARRLSTQAADDKPNNLFTDQRWCDFAPCFVDRLAVLKNPGYNVAYWNLGERQIAQGVDQAWVSNGQPLVFFHFSGIDPQQPDRLSKHQDRFDWSALPALRPLFSAYVEALHAQGLESVREWDYAYAQFEGLNLGRILRQLYRLRYPTAPADAKCAVKDLIGFANETEPGMPAGRWPRITRLMALIYAQRPDVRRAFSLATHAGRIEFGHWLTYALQAEYGLTAELLADLLVDAPETATTAQQASQLWRALPPGAQQQFASSVGAALTLPARSGAPKRSFSL